MVKTHAPLSDPLSDPESLCSTATSKPGRSTSEGDMTTIWDGIWGSQTRVGEVVDRETEGLDPPWSLNTGSGSTQPPIPNSKAPPLSSVLECMVTLKP